MITVDQAVTEFLISCRADGLKPSTVTWYRHHLKAFMVRFYGVPMNGVETMALRQYIADLQLQESRYINAPQRPKLDGGLSHDSLRNSLRAIRRFFNWCNREYDFDLAANPMRKIRIPARKRQEPKAISLADLKLLLDACQGADTFSVRNKAIVAFLADTGCRAGGLLGLNIADLHLSEGFAIVREKGDRTRAVPFTGYTRECLQRWLEIRPNFTEKSPVFCALGNGHVGQRLSLSGLNTLLKRLKYLSGAQGRVNPHAFRHGFAREYLRNGGDLGTLSQLMGHSTVTVTVSFYAVYSNAELAQYHEKFSPLRALEGR